MKQTPASSKPRLKGSDFQAWERYDVVKYIAAVSDLIKFPNHYSTPVNTFQLKDEALKDIDSQEDLQTQSTSDEDSEDEDIIEHRRLQQALFEKEKVYILC